MPNGQIMYALRVMGYDFWLENTDEETITKVVNRELSDAGLSPTDLGDEEFYRMIRLIAERMSPEILRLEHLLRQGCQIVRFTVNYEREDGRFEMHFILQSSDGTPTEIHSNRADDLGYLGDLGLIYNGGPDFFLAPAYYREV